MTTEQAAQLIERLHSIDQCIALVGLTVTIALVALIFKP